MPVAEIIPFLLATTMVIAVDLVSINSLAFQMSRVYSFQMLTAHCETSLICVPLFYRPISYRFNINKQHMFLKIVRAEVEAFIKFPRNSTTRNRNLEIGHLSKFSAAVLCTVNAYLITRKVSSKPNHLNRKDLISVIFLLVVS